LGVGLAATAHLAREYPGFETGDSWRDVRWTQLSVTVTVVAFGGPLGLPLAIDRRFGVVTLLCCVGFAGYVCGMLSVLDRFGDEGTAPSADPVTPSPSSHD
jgi:hypothetical protein